MYKNIKKIGYLETITNTTTKVINDKESFIKLSQREDIRDICLNKIPAAQKEGKDIKSLKELLPLIIFMAYCEENGVRPTKDTAIATGIVLHDIDHMQEADLRTWYKLNVEPFEKDLNIIYAGISCSGHGIRLLTLKNPGESIEECQIRVSNFLHVERDPKVKDISRGSFAVPYEYIIKLDDRLFDLPKYEVEAEKSEIEEPHESIQEEAKLTASVMPVLQSEAVSELTVYLECADPYQGVPIREIIHRLMEQFCADGIAKEGNRENTLFKIASHLRPITNCSFKETYELLAPLFRKLGLGDEEIRHAISSGVSQKGGYTRNPSPILQNILRSIRTEMGVKKEPIVLPPYDLLPPLVNEILKCYPKRQHMAVLVSLMAMLGTLATGVRFKNENRVQSLTFFATIMSQFGGGKAFIDDLEHKVLSKLLEEKKEVIAKAEKERKERLETSNLQVRQKHTDYPSQILATNTTSAQLFDSLNILNGKHGFLCTEEISALMGSMYSENGRLIAYIIKVGFDNGFLSKETKTDQSANVFFKCFLNLVLCGTPKMMMRFFNSTLIDDGTASRFVLVDLDPGLEEMSPKYLSLSPRHQKQLDNLVEKLSNIGVGKEHVSEDGDIEKNVEYFNCQYLINVIKEYYAEQVEVYKDGGDATFRQLANRAGLYGLRAGMLMWFIWGCPSGMGCKAGQLPKNEKLKMIAEFAKWFAEYVQNQQYRYFSKTIESNNEDATMNVRSSHVTIKNIDICSRFTGPFTSIDFQQLKYSYAHKYDQNPSQTLNRLADNPATCLVKCPNGKWEYKRNVI